MPRHNVVRFRIGGNASGASFYENMIEKAITDNNTLFVKFGTFKPEKKSWHLFRIVTYLAFWFHAHAKLWFSDISVAIVSPGCMLFLPKKTKVICIIHHYDPTPFRGLRQLYAKLAYCLVKHQKERIDCVITGAKVWKRFFERQGFKKVLIIQSAFYVDEMLRVVKDGGGKKLLKQHNLATDRYIYLGTFNPSKGQNLTAQEISDLGYTLVATNPRANTKVSCGQVKVISASFAEYNHLLKNARLAIAMSTFKEGWCRVLHEAAIHGTPILGSGLGGMRELLKLSMTRPSSFKSLRGDVIERLSQPKLSDEIIKNFTGFTSEKFKKEWLKVISDYVDE